MDDTDDPLMRGLADLLVKNADGELHRRALADTVAAPQGHDAPPAPPSREAPPNLEEGTALTLPRPGLLVDGKRALTRYIGSGSFGTVYEARQLDLDRLEAIKFLHERWMAPQYREVRERFLAEARVMARLSGPHLVEVYDWGTLPGGLPFFAMERLQGQTLRERLRDGEALSVSEVIELARQLLAGLCEAHEQDVVHRDVKPENVFLAHGGVKLLDFGLAKTSVAMTTTDAVMGTPLYMAPELLTSNAPPDARTDLYSAAAVMYELLAGRAPLSRSGMARQQLERAIVHEAPPPLAELRPDVPASLDALILEGLAKRQADRPASAAAMLDRLLELDAVGDSSLARTRPETGEARESDSDGEPGEAAAPTIEPEDGPEPSEPPGMRTHAPSESEPHPREDAAEDEPAPRRRSFLLTTPAVLVLALVALAAVAWPPSPAWDVSGGVLIVRSTWASDEAERTHQRLCDTLGGGRSTAADASVAVPAQCAVLSVWSASPDRLAEAGNEADAAAILMVDEGMVRLSLLDVGRRLPLLAELPVLELPTSASSVETVAPVLQGLLHPEVPPPAPLPVLDPARDGFHWTLMSETLRRYHGQRDPGARRRLESLARCTADHELAEVYCTLARMLHAMEMPCDRAAAPLRELLRSTDASATPMARPIRVELARCVIGSEPEDAVTEAETLAHAVLADGPDDPCVAASLMSTVARIARRGGDVDGTLRRRTALDSARLRACPARDMVVRVLGERANLAAADGRWCEAAEDNGEAHDLRPYRADVLVNWAEAALLCPSTTPATRDAILDELDPERFDSGPARTSVAFMRWMTARSPRAGQAVLRSWDEVPAGELPLLEGVASALSPCPSGPESCAYDLLRRPKAAEDRASLRRRLGLDQASPPG